MLQTNRQTNRRHRITPYNHTDRHSRRGYYECFQIPPQFGDMEHFSAGEIPYSVAKTIQKLPYSDRLRIVIIRSESRFFGPQWRYCMVCKCQWQLSVVTAVIELFVFVCRSASHQFSLLTQWLAVRRAVTLMCWTSTAMSAEVTRSEFKPLDGWCGAAKCANQLLLQHQQLALC